MTEQRKEYLRAWWKANRAKASAYRKAWRAADPERTKAFDAAQKKKYAARVRQNNRDYAAKNREWSRAQSKKWREANPEKAQEGNVRRRLRELNARTHGRLSHGLTKKLMAAQNYKCVYCPADLRVSGVHRDHIIPISKGGEHADQNMQALCPTCNLKKGNRLVPYPDTQKSLKGITP